MKMIAIRGLNVSGEPWKDLEAMLGQIAGAVSQEMGKASESEVREIMVRSEQVGKAEAVNEVLRFSCILVHATAQSVLINRGIDPHPAEEAFGA